jgi:hypothetical protein
MDHDAASAASHPQNRGDLRLGGVALRRNPDLPPSLFTLALSLQPLALFPSPAPRFHGKPSP